MEEFIENYFNCHMSKCKVYLESDIVDTEARDELGCVVQIRLHYIVIESPFGKRIAHWGAQEERGIPKLKAAIEKIKNLTTPKQLDLEYWYDMA